MKTIESFILKWQYLIMLLVFGLSVIFGMSLNQRAVDFLVEVFYENNAIIQYTGLAVNIFTIIFPSYLLVTFLILPIERKRRMKSEEYIDMGFKAFKDSLQELENGKTLDSFAFDYKIFFEFYYDIYRIEVSEFADKKLIKLHWFNSSTGNFVNERFINYANEPTVTTALNNGPWHTIKR